MAEKKYKILIVDDSKSVLKVLKSAFNKTPYKVKTVLSPVKAYELIENEGFNIVISDIEMPEMNGLELMKKIKQFNGMIQVIIITGYLTINNALNSFRYGAENLFFKPVDVNEIVAAVDTCAAKLDRVNCLVDLLAEKKG